MNEIKEKLDNLHSKILRSPFAKNVTESEIIALIESKKALEKQIPKKPIDNGLYRGIFATHKYYTCPKCSNACLEKMMNERQNTHYCWHCGQALLWEGVKNHDGE